MTKILKDDKEIKINPPTVISWTEKIITKLLFFNPLTFYDLDLYTYYFLNKTASFEKRNVRVSENDKKKKIDSNNNSINPLINEYELKFPVLYKKTIEEDKGTSHFFFDTVFF